MHDIDLQVVWNKDKCHFLHVIAIAFAKMAKFPGREVEFDAPRHGGEV